MLHNDPISFTESRRGMTPRYEVQQGRDTRFTPLILVEVWPDGEETPLDMFCFQDTDHTESLRETAKRMTANARPY